jgi:hypothetical protein
MSINCKKNVRKITGYPVECFKMINKEKWSVVKV